MRFDALFFARIDYKDKEKRLKDLEMEFLWRPFKDESQQSEIFSHFMFSHYSAPRNFCFYQGCTNDDSIVDNPLLKTYNVESKAKELVKYVQDQASHYRSSELFLIWGDDFNFQNARRMFSSMDKLYNYINEHFPEVNFFYSTPNQYIDALHKTETVFPTKYDDLFPYADHSHDYWTGYFTSRANFKGMIREAGQEFSSLNSWYCLASEFEKSDDEWSLNRDTYELFLQ